MPKIQGRNFKAQMWTVISDPTDDFKSGSKFSNTELKVMVKDCRVPVGMVLECTGKQYIVNLFGHIVEILE